MRSPLQRRPSGQSRLDSSPVQRRGRTQSPPENVIQASTVDATSRNGITTDEYNDASTAGYVPHVNDPTIWTDSGYEHKYGPRVEGPTAHRGEGDTSDIAANDVHQGALGNCYFLAALAGIAQQQPELIRNAIEGPLQDGTYNISLWSTSQWDESRAPQRYTFNMSPSFVVWGDLSDHPIRSVQEMEGQDAHSNRADRDEQGNMELWVKLLEKGFAIMRGGWEKVDGGIGGWPMMALETLTGERHYEHYFGGIPEHLQHLDRENLTRPSSRTDAISDEELRTTIIHNLEVGNVVTAENSGHAVTVISADEEGITLRDQARTSENDGRTTYTWADFRTNYMKFTTRLP